MCETKISVIIPVYNCEKTLETCLKSVFAQTLKEIEIICVNEGSFDCSLEILKKYEKKEKRLKIINKMNEGMGCALNTGLNTAKGEYVAFLCPLDYLDKKMYENLWQRAQTSGADIVKSSYFKFSGNKFVKTDWEKRCNIPSWYFRIMECPEFLSFNPSIWSCIYKKSFLNSNSIRFVCAKGKSFIDNPFQVESMLCAQKIVYTTKASYYRQNPTKPCQDIFAPFERCEEMLQILFNRKIKDKNLFMNIYKRIFWHTKNVLSKILNLSESDFKSAISQFDIKNIPYEIQLKIENLMSKIEESLVQNSAFFDEFEKELFMKLTRLKTKGAL